MPTLTMEMWKFVGSLFLFAGFAVVLHGTRLFFERRAFTRRAGPAEGTVIRRVAGDSGRRYHPVVLFYTPTGEQVVFQSLETFPDLRCRVGTRVPVLYDGADPCQARVNLRGWYDVVMTFYLGALVTAAGLVLTLQQLTP
jgi:Protein of unknown function (DUF3592)